MWIRAGRIRRFFRGRRARFPALFTRLVGERLTLEVAPRIYGTVPQTQSTTGRGVRRSTSIYIKSHRCRIDFRGVSPVFDLTEQARRMGSIDSAHFIYFAESAPDSLRRREVGRQLQRRLLVRRSRAIRGAPRDLGRVRRFGGWPIPIAPARRLRLRGRIGDVRHGGQGVRRRLGPRMGGIQHRVRPGGYTPNFTRCFVRLYARGA